MIFDCISNIEKYKGLSPNLDIAIDFIKTNKISQLTKGKNIIKGEDVFVNYNPAAQTIQETQGVYEMHKKYLDLHLDVEGTEKILFTDYVKTNETGAYSQEGDYVLLQGHKQAECLLDPHHFVLCMTHEPHMPCVRQGDREVISKVIFKIKIDKLETL